MGSVWNADELLTIRVVICDCDIVGAWVELSDSIVSTVEVVSPSEDPTGDNVLVNSDIFEVAAELEVPGNAVAVVVNTSETWAVMTIVDRISETKLVDEEVSSTSDVISSTDVAAVVKISKVERDALVSA